MMSDELSRFNWDEHNAGHIGQHKIRPEEVEQVLLNSSMPVAEEIHNGEERFLDIGHTETGKVLWVWWTLRDGRILPENGLVGGGSTPVVCRQNKTNT